VEDVLAQIWNCAPENCKPRAYVELTSRCAKLEPGFHSKGKIVGPLQYVDKLPALSSLPAIDSVLAIDLIRELHTDGIQEQWSTKGLQVSPGPLLDKLSGFLHCEARPAYVAEATALLVRFGDAGEVEAAAHGHEPPVGLRPPADSYDEKFDPGWEDKEPSAPSSSEFLRETQGDLDRWLFVDTSRFARLRRKVVDDIIADTYGGLTYGDTVNVELPILSYLAGLQREQPDGERTLEYDHGEEITVAEDEIIVSMQKVARAIAQRFYYYPTPGGSTTADKRFSCFYRSVVNAFGKLTDTKYLDHNGPAIETGDQKSDAYGQRYSVNLDLGSLDVGSAPPSIATAATPSSDSPADSYGKKFVSEYSEQGSSGRRLVDVPAMFDRLVMEHTEQWESFTEQASKSTTASESGDENFCAPERGVDGFDWQRRQAQPSTVERDDGKENSRHLTTGAYKPGHATHDQRSRLSCTVPFVVLEIDGETPQLCLEYARRILRWLDSIDVPVEEVTVTYTGNQSFHVRLPAGLFGKPIFRSTRVATRTIRELYRMIEDKIGKLGGAHVDGALASPLHHIRAIGSVHEGLYSKGKTRHCVGFRGDELLERSLQAIRQYAVNYSGHTLPDPAEGDTHNQLHELLSEAHSRAQTPESGKEGYAESRGIIDRIRAEGVEKGEGFAPGLVGRNFATRLLSLHLLQSGMSSQDAWNEIKDWNRKNIPPIGEAPDDYASELRYVFEKAQEDAPHL
jgi:hypothetical protein